MNPVAAARCSAVLSDPRRARRARAAPRVPDARRDVLRRSVRAQRATSLAARPRQRRPRPV